MLATTKTTVVLGKATTRYVVSNIPLKYFKAQIYKSPLLSVININILLEVYVAGRLITSQAKIFKSLIINFVSEN